MTTTTAATTTTTTARATATAVTAASNAFVAGHLATATELGERMAEVVHDPDAFVATTTRGFEALADPVYADGSRSVAPGLGPVLGVRLPLMEAANKTFKRGTRRTSTVILLDAMDRLLRHELRELRWFGIWNLERLIATDPERTWQLLRRAAGEADEWITVDTLAHPYGRGILADPRRWAEIEQLAFSPSRWERRLVGSTLATMPHVDRKLGRDPAVVRRGISLVGQLIGDAEPDVQKALSWALRNFAVLDPAPVTAFLEAEAEAARRSDDGGRAWVIRDSLNKLPADSAARLRATVDGIRRRPGAPSTSRAAATAAQFDLTGAAQRPAASTGRNSAP
jgi:3-methyladenine DNA glycosylase AlkD